MKDEIRRAYEAARQILTDCARGACPNPKDGEVSLGPSVIIKTCTACWNRHVAQRRLADKMLNDEAKATGIAFWAARGIKPGDPVKAFFHSWTGLGGTTIVGVARVGARGAYVHADSEGRKQIAPESFTRA